MCNVVYYSFAPHRQEHEDRYTAMQPSVLANVLDILFFILYLCIMHSSHKLNYGHFSLPFYLEKPLVVCSQSASKAKLKSTFGLFLLQTDQSISFFLWWKCNFNVFLSLSRIILTFIFEGFVDYYRRLFNALGMPGLKKRCLML